MPRMFHVKHRHGTILARCAFVKREALFRRAARSYGKLLREWTSLEGTVGADTLYWDNVDGELLYPPEPGEERSWLEKLQGRVEEWMKEWERRTGAAKERLRERLLRVVKAGKDAAEGLLQGNLNPWNIWERTLETGAAKEFAGGIGKALGWGLVAVGVVWFLTSRKGGK